MTEPRCDTCRHSTGYTRPEYVICHFDGDLPRIKPVEFCCGAYDCESDDSKGESWKTGPNR